MDLLICFRDHGLRRFAINLDETPFQTNVYVIYKHVVSLPSPHIQRYCFELTLSFLSSFPTEKKYDLSTKF